MLSWRTITRDRTGGGKVFILRLRDGEAIWRASPQAALDQELVQLKQRSERYAGGTQLHRGAGDGIDHPGRGRNDIARRNDEVDDAAVSALLAVLAAKTAPEIRMPAIVNLYFLPNMGRMNPRWPSRAGLFPLRCW
jgi:hypothetical protein